MSASGNEDMMADQVEGDEIPDFDTEDAGTPLLFATIQYEEGTSGPIKVAAGLLVDEDDGITIIDPEEGVATTIGDRFIVRVDVQQVEVEDEDDEDIDPDQVDTSADRFRA